MGARARPAEAIGRRGHGQLQTKNGPHARKLAGVVKLHRAREAVLVGERERVHAVRRGGLREFSGRGNAGQE